MFSTLLFHLFTSHYNYSCISIGRTYHCPICVAEFLNCGVEFIKIWLAIQLQCLSDEEKSCICLAGTVEAYSKLFSSSSLCMCSVYILLYHKISSDGWLLDPIEGALGWGASLEIKYGPHNAPALVWVSGSHYCEFLIWVVSFWLLCALCIINGRGIHGSVVTVRVAGVKNIGWVRRFLEC